MPQGKTWIDIASGLGALVAAIAAVAAICISFWLGRSQQQLQERQLKQDLFDKRFEIFRAVETFITCVL
jgi:hypothetical protein